MVYFSIVSLNFSSSEASTMWSECYDFQYQALNVFPNGDDGLSTAAQATGILISLLVQNLLAKFEFGLSLVVHF
jgi:hypothetical protein